MNYLLLLHLNLSGMFSWETSISMVSTYNMPLSSISRATAWSLIPYLTCRHKSFLSQLPIRSRHRFQKGLGQPWLKAPSCSHPPCGPPAAPGQYSLKQKSPPQLVPGSATVAAQAGSEQPLPQWWDSGLLHTAWVLLVGFTADSCSGAGGCMGLCQQDTGALFCFVLFFQNGITGVAKQNVPLQEHICQLQQP